MENHPTSFTSKLPTTLIAGITAGAAFSRIGHRFLTPWLPLPVIYGMGVMFVIVAIIATIVWHRREKNLGPQPATLAYWQGVLRYAVALDLTMFGLQKITHLQFFTPLAMLDEPFSSFAGTWLTWAYFGQSRPFVVIIALLQISGACLLLFRRTRLLAVFILMPVMLNIVLLDLFYDFEPVILAHACVHNTALLYLLLCERRRLWTFFLGTPSTLPPAICNPYRRNILRASAVIIPLILLATYDFPDHHPQLTGKYTVHNLRINGNPTRPTPCQDSVLTYVYLDIADECVFTYNSLDRRTFGHYTFDEATDSLQIAWRYPNPSLPGLRATLVKTTGDTLRLEGIVGADHITADVHRANR